LKDLISSELLALPWDLVGEVAAEVDGVESELEVERIGIDTRGEEESE